MTSIKVYIVLIVFFFGGISSVSEKFDDWCLLFVHILMQNSYTLTVNRFWILWQRPRLSTGVSGGPDTPDPQCFDTVLFPKLLFATVDCRWQQLAFNGLFWVVKQVSGPCVPNVDWRTARGAPLLGEGSLPVDCSRERGKGFMLGGCSR